MSELQRVMVSTLATLILTAAKTVDQSSACRRRLQMESATDMHTSIDGSHSGAIWKRRATASCERMVQFVGSENRPEPSPRSCIRCIM